MISMYRLAPPNDRDDFYAAGYDGNAFPTWSEARLAAFEMREQTESEWTVVPVPYDARALRIAGYDVEIAQKGSP